MLGSFLVVIMTPIPRAGDGGDARAEFANGVLGIGNHPECPSTLSGPSRSLGQLHALFSPRNGRPWQLWHLCLSVLQLAGVLYGCLEVLDENHSDWQRGKPALYTLRSPFATDYGPTISGALPRVPSLLPGRPKRWILFGEEFPYWL